MMLTEALIRHLKFHESLESAIEAPRFYMEDNKIYSEIRYSRGIRNELEEMGYDIELKSSPIYYGGIQAIVIDKGKSVIFGSADSRREGTWKVK
ncbi:gamma-glutamyltranspeptidase [Peribacillus cavernae]|nr:gamma-glutamyltranspeptidase [Peribacillus cavernae]